MVLPLLQTSIMVLPAAAQARQLAGARHVRHPEVLRDVEAAQRRSCRVSEKQEGERTDDHRTDREAVQPVGEVDGVGGGGRDEVDPHDVEDQAQDHEDDGPLGGQGLDKPASQLPEAQVSVHDGQAGRNAAYRVAVDIERFDATVNDSVAVQALWTIRQEGGKELGSGRFAATEPTGPGGHDAIAGAYAKALSAMSAQVAQAVRGAQAAPR